MKNTLAIVAVTTLMLAAVVACGKTGDRVGTASETSTTAAAAAVKASCDTLATLGTCNDYRSGTSFGLEKSLCDGLKGKFANQGCSTVGQIGSCAMSDGEIKRYYGTEVAGDHALTVEEAKGDCEGELARGTFTVAKIAPTGEAPAASGATARR